MHAETAVGWPESAHGQYCDQLLEIIGQEVQVTKDELSEETDFTALGIDRTLSKSIVNSFHRRVGFDLPEDFLLSHSNMASIEQYFYNYARSNPRKDFHVISSAQLKKGTTLRGSGSTVPHVLSNARPKAKASQAAASSLPLVVRLQGDPKTASQNIFLLPDGSGSAYSYIDLPIISPEVCVYAVNSPFLLEPRDGWSIEDTVQVWLAEIRNTQPEGPYILGGWSAGGYYVFEVAKQLLEEGQLVEKVILIDSPCRLVFEALPMEVVHYLYDHNMLGSVKSKQAPRWLLDHFHATIKAVENYHPSRITGNQSPEIFIIWASDVVFPVQGEARSTGLNLDVKVTRFMLENRSDFGPNGWDELFPRSKLAIAKTHGSHFTLAFHPNSEYLGGLIRDAVLHPADKRVNEWQYINDV